jgi:hypothetical protein
VVRLLLQHAAVVILRAGTSAGLMWEVSQIVNDIPPERVLFYVPCAHGYPHFRDRANTVLARELPRELGKSRFICFDADWHPRLIGRRRSILLLGGEVDGGGPREMRRELAGFLGIADVEGPAIRLLGAFFALVSVIFPFPITGLGFALVPKQAGYIT